MVLKKQASRTVLCRILEKLGRADLVAEKRKKESIYWLGLALALGAMQIAFSATFPNSPARDFEMAVFLVAAVSGMLGLGMLFSGQAGDLLDRRYLPLLYLFSEGTFLAEDGLALEAALKKGDRPQETWAILKGKLKDGGDFVLELATRTWVESDRVQREYQVNNPRYDAENPGCEPQTITATREVVLHRREFEQDMVDFVLTRDPAWDAPALRRHLPLGAGPNLALEECVAEPGRLQARFLSGVARTVSGEGRSDLSGCVA